MQSIPDRIRELLRPASDWLVAQCARLPRHTLAWASIGLALILGIAALVAVPILWEQLVARFPRWSLARKRVSASYPLYTIPSHQTSDIEN